MNLEQIGRWRAAAERLGLDVVAPFRLTLRNGTLLEATALVRVGPANGIVVDPEWSILAPCADQLTAEGFGYSAVTIGEEDDLLEMLQEWAGD